MDVYRFAKLPRQANDPARRYEILREFERDRVGNLEISGEVPVDGLVALTVTCNAILADAAREEALNTSLRFFGEIAAGWGLQVTEPTSEAAWVEEPDGSFRVHLKFRVSS